MIASIFTDSKPMTDRDVQKKHTSATAEKAAKINTATQKHTTEQRIAKTKVDTAEHVATLDKSGLQDYIDAIKSCLIPLERSFDELRDNYIQGGSDLSYHTEYEEKLEDIKVLQACLDVATQKLAELTS